MTSAINAVKRLKPETYESLLKELCPCCKAGLPIDMLNHGQQYNHFVPGWYEKHPGGACGFVCDAAELRKLRDAKT